MKVAMNQWEHTVGIKPLKDKTIEEIKRIIGELRGEKSPKVKSGKKGAKAADEETVGVDDN